MIGAYQLSDVVDNDVKWKPEASHGNAVGVGCSVAHFLAKLAHGFPKVLSLPRPIMKPDTVEWYDAQNAAQAEVSGSLHEKETTTPQKRWDNLSENVIVSSLHKSK